MQKKHSMIVSKPDLALDTSYGYYTIRVKGRLDTERWVQWFDGMTVTVQDGETVISGPIPDQAALYGMLSRLRDLALPLLSVEKVGDDAGSPPKYSGGFKRFPGRINWVLILLYLLLTGASVSMTVYLTSEGLVHTALALGVLFAVLGGIAVAFWRLAGGWGWRLIAWINGLAAGLTLLIFLMLARWLPAAAGIALMLFAAAGLIAYGVYHRPVTAAPRPVKSKDAGARDAAR